jgi:Tfp pilus assembly protein PilX
MNKRTSFATSRRQDGVVLIVAMVMLVVIGLASVAIMRNTLANDIVADNGRVQTQAMQAAQAGLRYCESLVQANSAPQAAAVAPAPETWTAYANWASASDTATLSSNSALNVPLSFVTSGDPHATLRSATRMRPQCMAQMRTLGSDNVVVVTARGFSDNYTQDAVGHTTAGAVIWLQSIIKVM